MTDQTTPPAMLQTTVTYLEMLAPPTRPTAPSPPGKHAVLRAENPTLAYYRFLYNSVGEAWNWTDRRLLDDETLGAIISDSKVEIYVLYASGVPAGFAELDRRQENQVELAYFGLIPEFVGRGLGKFLLDWAIHAAWLSKPKRLWVHTCTLDHPSALPIYQRAGFNPYKQEIEEVTPLDAVPR